MNLVLLTGNLARDVNYTPGSDGKRSSVRFTVGTRRNYKNKDGGYDADFVSCTAFGNTADFVNKYFKKGSSVEVRGSWHSGSYEKDGTKVYTNECYVDDVSFGRGGTNGNGNSESHTNTNTTAKSVSNYTAVPYVEEEELPWK